MAIDPKRSAEHSFCTWRTWRGSSCARTRSSACEAQLNDILEAVSKVSELDLADVPPTSHPLEVVNVWEADEPRPCLSAEEALANAPEREGDFFKVPPGGAV